MIEIVRNNFSVDPKYMLSGLDARAENGYSQIFLKTLFGFHRLQNRNLQRKLKIHCLFNHYTFSIQKCSINVRNKKRFSFQKRFVT